MPFGISGRWQHVEAPIPYSRSSAPTAHFHFIPVTAYSRFARGDGAFHIHLHQFRINDHAPTAHSDVSPGQRPGYWETTNIEALKGRPFVARVSNVFPFIRANFVSPFVRGVTAYCRVWTALSGLVGQWYLIPRALPWAAIELPLRGGEITSTKKGHCIMHDSPIPPIPFIRSNCSVLIPSRFTYET